jgi:tetratricopeptide (TPR) repeat protein
MSRRPVIALLLLLLPCTVRAADRGWVQIRTPHYFLITDGSEKKGQEAGLRMEQMRSAFATLLQRNKINVPVPTEIIAFGSRAEFEKYAPLSGGKPAAVPGFLDAGQDKNFIVVDASSPEPYSAVLHDYAHMLLNANYPRTQPWFDEGFAEYFSGAQLTNKEALIGVAHEGYTQLLNSSAWMPLSELFRVSPGSAVYNESGDRRSLFYAESWVLVHYIFDKQKLPETSQYFDMVENQKMRPAEAITKAFGMAPDALLKDVQAYYRSGHMTPWRMATPESLNPDLYPIQKVLALDAQGTLADLHAHSRDYQDVAANEFESILKTEPSYMPAHRGLGYLAMQKKQFINAAKYFKDAIALNAKDPVALYYSALLLSMRQNERDMHPSDPVMMETYLVGATNLYSDFAAAWDLLAEARMQQDKFEPAIAAAVNAVQLNPREEKYQQRLGNAYIAARQWDNAKYVFTALESSHNETVAREAEETLQQIEAAKAGGKFVAQKKSAGQNAGAVQPEESPIDHGAPAPASSGKADLRPVKFLKATLAGVSCDGKSAVLQLALTPAVTKGGKPARIRTLKMLVPDIQQVILINADTFSCDWHNQKVGLNYKEPSSPSTVANAGAYEGDVVSIEIR